MPTAAESSPVGNRNRQERRGKGRKAVAIVNPLGDFSEQTGALFG